MPLTSIMIMMMIIINPVATLQGVWRYMVSNGTGCLGVSVLRFGEIETGPSHTGDLKIGTPVATLPGAWCYRVSAGTGRPSVSIL